MQCVLHSLIVLDQSFGPIRQGVVLFGLGRGGLKRQRILGDEVVCRLLVFDLDGTQEDMKIVRVQSFDREEMGDGECQIAFVMITAVEKRGGQRRIRSQDQTNLAVLGRDHLYWVISTTVKGNESQDSRSSFDNISFPSRF